MARRREHPVPAADRPAVMVPAPTRRVIVTVIELLWMRLIMKDWEWTPDVARAFRKQENRQRWEAERRERLRTNGPRDRYAIVAIGDRDGWTCQFCGDPKHPPPQPGPRGPGRRPRRADPPRRP